MSDPVSPPETVAPTDALPRAAVPEPLLDTPALQRALRINHQHDFSFLNIERWQIALDIDVTGRLDEAFVLALANLQQQLEIEISGILDAPTIAHLDRIPVAVETSIRSTLSPSQRQEALCAAHAQCQHRPTILSLQQRLDLPPTGVIDHALVNAIVAWQLQRQRVPSGRWDEDFCAAMDLTLPSPSIPPGPHISPHFRWEDFRSTGDHKAPPLAVRPNLVALCEQLEILRAALKNRTITILSGWRTPWWNKRMGGGRDSLHLHGAAADFVVAGLPPSAVRQVMEELIDDHKLYPGGLGRYATFTHYDLRLEAARWNG